MIAAAYSLIFALDFMNSETIEPFKLAWFTFLSGGLIYSVFLPDAVSDLTLNNGDLSLQIGGLNRILIYMLAFSVIVVYLFYTFQVYSNALPKYQKYALLHLLGAIIFGPITLLMFITQVGVRFPGSVALISSLGILMSTIAISRSPQLIYTLPFKLYDLEIIEQKSGLVIFSHQWGPERQHDQQQLVGASLEGINMFVEQALELGYIREIVLETGNLILHDIPKTKFYAILLASTSSPVLRQNLKAFSEMFSAKFKDQLYREGFAKKISAYKSASDFIPLAFPYIPA